MRVLVTGTAGFIGYHVAKYLLERGDDVTGVDSINDYYDLRIKYGRLNEMGIAKDKIEYGVPCISSKFSSYNFIKLNIEDKDAIDRVFKENEFDGVINLAAQAGVRYSLGNPHAYIDSNIVGFVNILEECRQNKIGHLVYASSSSVYGINKKMPFSTSDNVDHPISLYAASKKSNELMAHTYSHLFNIPTTGLRFFTVYGPWGRPDMALFIFTKAMLKGESIPVFNNGNMRRDFTYIDDIVEGIIRVLDRPPQGNPQWSGLNPDPASSSAPYKIYNIGRGKPIELMGFITTLEKELDCKAAIDFKPMQPGDVSATSADCTDLEKDTGYKPATTVDYGIGQFASWYKSFYNIK